MAGEAFKDKNTLKLLENFVTILVDGDVEKDVTKKFGVRGYPNTKFLGKKNKVLEDVGGYVPTGRFNGSIKSALKKNGKIKFKRKYKALMKANEKLAKALKKDQYKNALRAIAAIRKIGHVGPDLQAAEKHEAAIAAVAQERFAAAEKMEVDDPKRARQMFLKIKSTFDGIELAKEAKKRAAAIKTK